MRVSRSRRVFLPALLLLGAFLLGGCAQLRASGAGGGGGVWLWDNPRMAGNDLRAVAFVDGQEGWAVGDRGTIVHTKNAGASDTVGTPPFVGPQVLQTRTEFSGTSLALFGVSIAPDQTSTVYAVGEEGTMVRTVNGGRNWLPVVTRVGEAPLFSVDAVSATDVWAAGGGGVIFHAHDGSGSIVTWASHKDLLAVDFVSPSVGYIAGKGRTLLKTTNGGTWTAVTPGGMPASADIRSLSFASADVGYATTWDGAEGALWKTTDGGSSWTKQFAQPGATLDSVSASGTAEVWAAGANGLLVHADGSSTTTQALAPQDLHGTCAAGGTAWAVGDNGRVFAWTGAWSERSSIVTLDDMNAYSAVAQRAVGAHGEMLVWPGGPFSNAPALETLPTDADLTAIWFTDPSTGWITGADGVVYRYAGGSMTGTSSVPVAPTSVTSTDGVNVWLTGNLGEDGYVLHSADAGSSWTTATTYPHVHLHGVAASGDHVYAVGGYTFGSADSAVAVFNGSTWTQSGWPTGQPLRAVAALSTRTAVVVGDGGALLRTEDGGHLWAWEHGMAGIDMNAVSFDGLDGRAVGDGGAILGSTDGGVTWFSQDSGTNDDLRGVDVNGVSRAVGSDGCVLLEARLPIETLFGASRYDTAIAVSKATWTDESAPTVVIATGENWPDAVCGSSLAGAVDGPMLLTRRLSVPAGLVGEMKRLGTTKAYVLGSTKAVDESVVTALKTQMGSGFTVERVYGADRYETSANIASATVDAISAAGGTYDHSAFLATGLNWPDALAVAPVAMHAKEPVLLARPTGIPSSVASMTESLGVTSGVVLGSGSVVPTSVADAFATLTGNAVARWYGPSRYDTAADIARHAISEKGLTASSVAFATGFDFPDALSGGAAQGHRDGVLLLTPPSYLWPADSDLITANRPSELRFIGGTNVLFQRPRNEAAWDLLSGF